MIYMDEEDVIKINEVRRTLDDYPNFSEAVRRLIRIGMASLEPKIKDEPNPEFPKDESTSTEEEYPIEGEA